MRFTTSLPTGLLALTLLFSSGTVQAQKVKSVAFTYLPEQSEDRYNQRVSSKTLPLAKGGFIILAHKSASEYAVERYDAVAGNLPENENIRRHIESLPATAVNWSRIS